MLCPRVFTHSRCFTEVSGKKFQGPNFKFWSSCCFAPQTCDAFRSPDPQARASAALVFRMRLGRRRFSKSPIHEPDPAATEEKRRQIHSLQNDLLPKAMLTFREVGRLAGSWELMSRLQHGCLGGGGVSQEQRRTSAVKKVGRKLVTSTLRHLQTV